MEHQVVLYSNEAEHSASREWNLFRFSLCARTTVTSLHVHRGYFIYAERNLQFPVPCTLSPLDLSPYKCGVYCICMRECASQRLYYLLQGEPAPMQDRLMPAVKINRQDT